MIDVITDRGTKGSVLQERKSTLVNSVNRTAKVVGLMQNRASGCIEFKFISSPPSEVREEGDCFKNEVIYQHWLGIHAVEQDGKSTSS